MSEEFYQKAHAGIQVGDEVYATGWSRDPYVERSTGKVRVDGPFVVERKSAAGRLCVKDPNSSRKASYSETQYFPSRKAVLEHFLQRTIKQIDRYEETIADARFMKTRLEMEISED